MKYSEMIKEFKKNKIDITKFSCSYGLLATRPGEGFDFNIEKNIFQHIIFGDRDNGNIDKIYLSEDDMVKDMIDEIISYAESYKKPYKNNYNIDIILNQKILDIAMNIKKAL